MASQVIKCENIDCSKIIISDKLSTDKSTQESAFMDYDGPNGKGRFPFIQTDEITITGGGIPPANPLYDATKRECLKIPLDDSQEACRILRAHFVRLDDMMESKEVTDKLLGQDKKKYEYQPCIRSPIKPTYTSKSGKEYKNYDTIKMVFNFEETAEGRKNKTILKKMDGATDTIVQADTMADIENEIGLRSIIKIIYSYKRIWINKRPIGTGKNAKIPYGITIGIMVLKYTPASKMAKVNPTTLRFIEDSEETVSAVKKVKELKFDDTDDNDNNIIGI